MLCRRCGRVCRRRAVPPSVVPLSCCATAACAAIMLCRCHVMPPAMLCRRRAPRPPDQKAMGRPRQWVCRLCTRPQPLCTSA
eukprot:2854760-Prymnesium_polylepis.1